MAPGRLFNIGQRSLLRISKKAEASDEEARPASVALRSPPNTRGIKEGRHVTDGPPRAFAIFKVAGHPAKVGTIAWITAENARMGSYAAIVGPTLRSAALRGGAR